MPTQRDRKDSKSAVDIWRPRDFESIELHRGSGITFEYPRHWHDEIYLCAILEGAAYTDCPGTSIFTPPGTLALVPSGEVHANRKFGCTFRCIFIEFEALQSAAEQFVEQSIPGLSFRTTLIDDTPTMASFLRLHRSLEKPSSRLGRDHSLLVFLHRLLARHSTASITVARDGNEDSAVRRSQKFLDEHYAEPVPLSELAQLTGLSPYHLNRSFCRKVGMPPHAYQLQVRIARAKSAAHRIVHRRGSFGHRFRRPESLHACLQTPGRKHARTILVAPQERTRQSRSLPLAFLSDIQGPKISVLRPDCWGGMGGD